MTTFDATLGALVQQQPVSFNATGTNLLILGIPGQIIKVLQFFYVAAAATNLTFQSASTPLSGPLEFPSAAAHVLDFIQLPLQCNMGDSFTVNLSTGVQVGGTIWFIQS